MSQSIFSALARQLFTCIYLHSGRAATEHAQTTVIEPKKEEELPAYHCYKQNNQMLNFKTNFGIFSGTGIWPKIRLGNGIWAKFGLGNGIYTPPPPPPSGPSKKHHWKVQLNSFHVNGLNGYTLGFHPDSKR